MLFVSKTDRSVKVLKTRSSIMASVAAPDVNIRN